MMVSCEISMDTYCPGTAMTQMPASWPAEVSVVMEMSKACHQLKPEDTAMIPKLKETERYPRNMGIPALNPELNSFLFKAESI